MVKTLLATVVALACGSWAMAADPTTQLRMSVRLDLGNGVRMDLLLVRAGQFTMGGQDGEERQTRMSSRSMDRPQHEVTISKPFYMGVHEVTQEQYQEIMGKNPSRHRESAKQPVEQVSWFDAMEFCKKLSAKTGKTVSLPTEAQWEYACRAGTTTWLYWRDQYNEKINDYAWCPVITPRFTTHPVGQLTPNDWGFHDMYGNVFEWCADWYADYGDKAAVDPRGPESGKCRVKRGGSFYAGGCGSYFRYANPPQTASQDIGFRVVVVAE